MIVVCLKVEAVDDGPRRSATLVMHRAMKGAVVGSEGGVEVEVWALVCVMGQGDDLLYNRARFLWATSGSVVWVAVEVTAVGVSQSDREIPLCAGSSVWTAMERAAMAANLVTFCSSTEHLERTETLIL